VSLSFGYIPKSGIAGSYGRSMFRFLRSRGFFLECLLNQGTWVLYDKHSLLRASIFLFVKEQG
jgi:hypothetical protein